LLHEGIELTDAGQLAHAIRAFEEAIKLNPAYAEAYAALGRAYFKMREWRRAADNLHRAAALNAKLREAKKSLQAQSAASKPAEAVPTLAAERRLNKPAGSQLTAPTAERLLTPQPATTPPPPKPEATPKRQKVPEAKLIEVSTSTALATTVELKERSAPEVTPDEKPEVTRAEKTTSEDAPLKSDAVSTPEEKEEPKGANVSMSASPISSTIESGSVSPIPLNVSNEDISLTKVYRVGPGDVLDVRVNEAQPQQSTLFTVTPAGLLEHPLLAEPLNVAALTTEEIQTRIQDDLKKRALIEEPAVTVAVRDYASHTILVSGLVKEPGTKFLRREAIPLYVVVADAQPLPEAAKVAVVRNELNQIFEIDLANVAHMNLLVRRGDVINLQPNETQFIYVGGEVKAAGEKIFRRGLTLTQAIISAGGMTKKARVAEVGRDDGQGFLTKTSYKLKDIQSGKTMDPPIRAGDRIMILR
jgi:protein involved in polysaccharide export with SLBB domain